MDHQSDTYTITLRGHTHAHALLGLARDLGHHPTVVYGDDGKLQFSCDRCEGCFASTTDAVLFRSIVDFTCSDPRIMFAPRPPANPWKGLKRRPVGEPE